MIQDGMRFLVRLGRSHFAISANSSGPLFFTFAHAMSQRRVAWVNRRGGLSLLPSPGSVSV